MQNIVCKQGLEDVEFEVPVGSSDSNSNLVSHDLGTYHCHGLTLGGVNFARHNRRSRLVFRKKEFSKSTSRTRP